MGGFNKFEQIMTILVLGLLVIFLFRSNIETRDNKKRR